MEKRISPKIRYAVERARLINQDLPVAVRLKAILVMDTRQFSGLPGVTWLRAHQDMIQRRLEQINDRYHSKWVYRTPKTYPMFRNAVIDEIERRGGETSIEEKRKVYYLHITDIDRENNIGVVHAEGWRHYSNRFGARPAALSYFCGFDDGHVFAARVPGTIVSIKEAIDWLTPASVKKAQAQHKSVTRQGDVYAVQTTKIHDEKGADDLGSHRWNSDTRELCHPEHGTLKINYPCRFIRQKAYSMGRTSTRSAAD